MSNKWNKSAVKEGGLDSAARLRMQDDKFCQMLRAAVERGHEYCPTSVSTAPCTKRPVLNYTRPE
jgi:hypothetical protein